MRKLLILFFLLIISFGIVEAQICSGEIPVSIATSRMLSSLGYVSGSTGKTVLFGQVAMEYEIGSFVPQWWQSNIDGSSSVNYGSLRWYNATAKQCASAEGTGMVYGSVIHNNKKIGTWLATCSDYKCTIQVNYNDLQNLPAFGRLQFVVEGGYTTYSKPEHIGGFCFGYAQGTTGCNFGSYGMFSPCLSFFDVNGDIRLYQYLEGTLKIKYLEGGLIQIDGKFNRNTVLRYNNITYYTLDGTVQIIDRYASKTINVTETNVTYNIPNFIPCFSDIPLSGYTPATLQVLDAANNKVKLYGIADNVTNSYNVVDNYVFDVSHLLNRTVNFTVHPLLETRAERSGVVNVTNQTTFILNNTYIYTLSISTVYSHLLGTNYLFFRYTVTGSACPNKDADCFEYTVGGTADGKLLLQLFAGSYTITLKTKTGMIERSKEFNISLLDNQYYKNIVWSIGLLSDELNLETGNASKLKIIVVDQNGKAVQNALVSIDDLISAKTDVNGSVVFDVAFGDNYTVKVYVANNLKAIKYIQVDDVVVNYIIQITLSDEERRQLVPTPTTPTPAQPTQQFEFTADKITAIMSNPAIWGLIIVIGLAIVAAANAGERIGLITFVAALGVFTYIIPLLPQVIFIVVAIVAMILFSWKVVGRLVGGGEE